MRPALSIVIPSHRRTDLLGACLDSVVRYAPARSQIIVVDDGSLNGSVTVTTARFPGIDCVRLPHRSGFCRAANAGINAAGADIVELLNDDTEVTAGWAEAALDHFSDAKIAAVAPLVLWREKSGPRLRVDSAADRYYLGGIAAKRDHGRPLDGESLEAGPVFGASGSSAFYRREALLRVGAFPAHFGAYFEDVDLAFRLHRAGYEVMHEPRSRVYHRVSASYGRPGRALLERQSLNEERVFWRNVPGSALGSALPRHAAVLAAKAWKRWQEGGLAPFICGRLRLLGEMGEVRRHRQWLGTLGPAGCLDEWQVERRYWGSVNDFV